MKISQSIRSTLLVAITEAIQSAEVTGFGSIEFKKGWQDSTLAALGEEFSRSLSNALDGITLSSFVSEQIDRMRMESGEKELPSGIKLTSVDCFKNALDAARLIVAALERVPTQYRLIIRLNVEMSQLFALQKVEVKLSDRLRILSGSLIPQSFKVSHDDEEIDDSIKMYVPNGIDLSIERNSLYLEYRTSGYLGMRRQSRAVTEFYDEVRAFYGACVAYGIFLTYDHWGEQSTPYTLGNSIVDSVEELAYVERPEDDIIKCSNLATSVGTDKKAAAGDSLGKLLDSVAKVYKSSDVSKLKTACAWVLRAHLSRRGLDKILESAITIEVLMGDRDTSDRIGLSKLIANRCAYSLGGSSKSRSEMIEFFAKFYKVRSEVVHSGRTALHADERRIVEEGLSLATRILKHEISMA